MNTKKQTQLTLERMLEIRSECGLAELLTYLVDGDSMTVPLRDLEYISFKLAQLGQETAKRLEKTNIDQCRIELLEIDSIESYIKGITYARLSLKAAGVEVAA